MNDFCLLNKNFVFYCLLLLTTSLLSCRAKEGAQENRSNPVQTIVEDSNSILLDSTELDTVTISKRIAEETIFKLPKYIDRDRLVVAFHDDLCKCPIAIVYEDADKTKATRITFYPDGQTDRKKLIPLSASSFGERFEDWPEDKPHYDVFPAIVQYVHTNGSIGATYEVIETE